MAADIFLKLGDIKGESLDDKHKDEIEVLSYSWGVSNPSSIDTGSGGGHGKASFGDIVIQHYVDKSSPNLMVRCCSGEPIPDVTLTQRKSGKGQQEYLIIKMNEVIVTHVQQSAGGSASNSESFGLAFAKIAFEYKPQNDKGALEAGIFFKYDVKKQVSK